MKKKKKKCKECGERKPLAAFSLGRRKCKACRAAQCARYYERNRKAILMWAKNYYRQNRATVNARQARYYKQNREARLAWLSRYRERNRSAVLLKHRRYWRRNRTVLLVGKRNASKALTDSYIKHALVQRTHLKFADLPQALVEAKREQLKIYRQLRSSK